MKRVIYPPNYNPTSQRSAQADILCFCHLKWTFVFQRPQHLMVRWAEGTRVFFIEEPQEHDGPSRMMVHQCPSGVMYACPEIPRNLSDQERIQELNQLLREFLEVFEVTRFVRWYYTPLALPWSRGIGGAATVYDCMDELSHFKGADPRIQVLEKELLKAADVVFTGGHNLYKLKSPFHHNIHAFPSSVDNAHYSQARQDLPAPPDQVAVPRPRLGFFGVIDERLDVALIEGLARRRPAWQIILIGPVVKIDPASLPRLPNIHYLGQKDYARLPLYLSSWDVALLPFARNDSTKYISPTKTLEYLAGGKPVVSTSIEDVVHPYGHMGLVRIADTVDETERAVLQTLEEDPTPRRMRADAYLAQHSWDITWGRMKTHVQAAVEEREARAAAGGGRPVKDAYDFVVVGAGFAGAVAAECLAARGYSVLICDKRPHVGGNAYDHLDAAGILVHRYGPHIFHTNADDVFNYLSEFTEWRPYEHRVLTCVDGKFLPMPINLDTINRLYNWNLDSYQLEEFFKKVAEPRDKILTSEDVIISKVGRALYEKFFRNYTRKQWGLDPSELDSTVIARIPVRTSRDDRYFSDKHQVMPAQGFTPLFENMLADARITRRLGVDYQSLLPHVSYKGLIYSGPIDSFFGYCYGRLPYRSLEFRHETHARETFQPGPVVNYPNTCAHTRITEFKYLTGQKHAKTSIVYEFSRPQGDPYYPIPRKQNTEVYQKYLALAQHTARTYFVGRLATYKYYNMDQVVAQALTLASSISGASRKELLEFRGGFHVNR